ncbi:hypothetical protein BCAR13_60218 [Paraburkholderia caribensis]|nr:hypothetical protein BCAR13_60218 [Paraburkholderia caribensis]
MVRRQVWWPALGCMAESLPSCTYVTDSASLDASLHSRAKRSQPPICNTLSGNLTGNITVVENEDSRRLMGAPVFLAALAVGGSGTMLGANPIRSFRAASHPISSPSYGRRFSLS